ncbi:MAG: glycosyltransferase [Cytophagales bacterium]|nr:MAG: glycosyltransferase [Cytophagales bacterium]
MKNVSFVVPAYNCAATIIESIDSIFDDNFIEGDEIIIVNDASQDSTAIVLKQLKKQYPIIQIINNEENKGCPATRNVGIRQAKNSIIFNLDADNILERGSRIKLLTFMQDQQADFVAFGEIHFFREGKDKITHKWVCKSGTWSLADFLAGMCVPADCFVYTKASWEKIGGYWEYEKGLHEFWGYVLKHIAMGSKFATLPHSCYYHRYGMQTSLFLRENYQSQNISSLMATKMIEPFLDQIEEEDKNYILSEIGRKTWYDNIEKRPIRVKNIGIGEKGKVILTHEEKTAITATKKQSSKQFIKQIIKSFLQNTGLLALAKKTFLDYQLYKNDRQLKIGFKKDIRTLKSLSNQTVKRFELNDNDMHPCLTDKTSNTNFDTHYIYHPAWAARILQETKPEYHIDISSTLHFCSIISAFVPVLFYDFRPADLRLSNLTCASANLTNLHFKDNSIDSLSCMHVVEHIGLGRYGDPLDYGGDLKAMNELQRVLAAGGNLLFVTPIGKKAKIAFNAHRIYTYSQIINNFDKLKLVEFALIPFEITDGGLIRNAPPELADNEDYGCGCFWFKKEER